jgi:hypothetical protein
MMPAMEYKVMFFKQMVAVFLDRTKPDSSIAKPAAINMTMAPVTKKEKVFKIYDVSAETWAKAGAAMNVIAAAVPVKRILFFMFCGS